MRQPMYSETDKGNCALADAACDGSENSITQKSKMYYTYPSGSKPLDRYTIRRGVGVGGFGEVYFAVSDAGKEVALKRIQRNLDIELRGVSHCLNLKHPHLVSLHDVCRDNQDQAWVVMEYVAGPNLRTVLDRKDAGLEMREVYRVFTGLAAGVAYLHNSGIVHRDLKPGNVFDDAGVVKIGDYGLSKFISSSHRGGHTESVGTFHYMAPEVGRGEYGREVDIYALGIILFELITGRVPFEGESGAEIIMKHLTALPDLSAVAQPYRQVIGWALQKDPALRPKSVVEMVKPLGIEFDEFGIPKPNRAPGKLLDPSIQETTGTQGLHRKRPSAVDPIRTKTQRSVQKGCGTYRCATSHKKSTGHSKRKKPYIGYFLLGGLLVVWFGSTIPRLLPLAALAATIYIPFRILRSMLQRCGRQPNYAEAHRQAVLRQQTPKPLSITEWRRRMRVGLAMKPRMQQAAELFSSWSLAGLTVTLLTFFAGMFVLRDADLTGTAIAPFTLLAASVGLASILLLGMGKFWESSEGDGLPRRLVLLSAGAVFGATVYGLSQFLITPLMEADWAFGSNAERLPRNLYNLDGSPMAQALMMHFAILFASVRWWKLVDPLRLRRVSLWPVAVAMVAEWAIQLVLPIPTAWGILAVGGTALVIQMTAPWEDAKQRLPETPIGAVG